MSGSKGNQPQRQDSPDDQSPADASTRDTQQEQPQNNSDLYDDSERSQRRDYPRIQVSSLLSDASGSTSVPKHPPSNPSSRSTTAPPPRPSESEKAAADFVNNALMGTPFTPARAASVEAAGLYVDVSDLCEQPPPGRTTNEIVIGMSRTASLAQTPATRSATLSQAQSGVATPANEDQGDSGTAGQSGAEDATSDRSQDVDK
jgi:hypothetical protein